MTNNRLVLQQSPVQREGDCRWLAGSRNLLVALAVGSGVWSHLGAQEPGTAPPRTPAVEKPAAPPSTSSRPTRGAGPRKSLDELLETRGSLALREGSLADWLLAIQMTWDVDILYDNDELQRVQYTGKLTNATLKEILDTILPGKNYSYRRKGNALLIVPFEAWGDAVRPDQKLELFRLEHANPAEVEPTLRFLLSPHGRSQVIASSKTLMVVDSEENVVMIREHIRRLDERARQTEIPPATETSPPPTTAAPSPGAATPEGGTAVPVPVEQVVTTVLQVKYLPATAVQESVQTQLGDGHVNTVVDGNMLVVSGPESAVRSAMQVVRNLDFPRKQVRISVLMYDIRVEALEQLGVNWRNAAKGRISANGVPRDLLDLNSSPMPLGSVAGGSSTGSSGGATGGTGTGTTPGAPTGGTTSTGGTGTASGAGVGSFVTSAAPNLVGSALTITHLSRHFDLSAVILALDQTDGARLLARPNVTCYDRKESTIKIISEIPVQQLTQTDMGGNIGTTTFREAGVSLTVTPAICDNGQVLMTLNPEFSVLAGFQAGQPIIDRRMQTGTVLVGSGDTLVLGGLRRRNELETVSGIPGLMNLKYIGNLFRSHRTTLEESELITFIHTEIIDGDFVGDAREQMAAQVVDETLNRIPMASHAPYIPPCNDPYCPIHNPRPKHWPGNMLGPDAPPPHWHPAPESLPMEGPSPLPAPPGATGVPAPPQAPPQVVTEPRDQSPPSVAPPVVAPPGVTPPRQVPEFEPPPVRVDEAMRREPGNRLALRRLPQVAPAMRLEQPAESPGVLRTAAARVNEPRSVGTVAAPRGLAAPSISPPTTTPAALPAVGPVRRIPLR